MIKKYWPLLIIFASVLVLYFPVLNTYFSGDDFFAFRASLTDGSLQQFLDFFKFSPVAIKGYAFYRPIFREILHYSFYNLFGLNHIPLRLLSFAIHFANIALVYLLFERLFNKRFIAFFTSLFFGITAANVGTLYYMAGGTEVSGATFFMLLTVLLFWEYLSTKNLKFKLLSIGTFVLALASHELSVITPFLLAGIIFVRQKRIHLKRTITSLLPYLLLLLFFLYLDIFVIGHLRGELQYKPVISIGGVINSLFWYAGWAFGLPEMLLDFVRPGLTLNPNLMKYWSSYFFIIFPSFFVSAGILLVFSIYALRNKILSDRRFWFLLLWFPMALAPILILPQHKQTHYLVPALPAFFGSIFFIANIYLSKVKKKYAKLSQILFALFVTSLFILSLTSIRLAEKTYPAVQRGKIAEKLLNEIRTQYSSLPSGSIIYIINDPTYPFISSEWGGTSKQANLILSGSDAIQLIYKDPTLQVYYEDLSELPENLNDVQVFSFVAKIN